MFLTPKHLYFHSQMLGVLKVEEELAHVATVVADENDKINRAIVVTLDTEEPRQWRFLSFREDVKTVISTILEMSEATHKPTPSKTGEKADEVVDEQPIDEKGELVEEVVEQPEEATPAPVGATPSSPKLRQRPPGMVVPKPAAEVVAEPKAASVIDSIRQRQQKEKLERQQYAERLRQKAESQSKAVSDAELSRSGNSGSSGEPAGLEALLDLLPLAKRFVALFALIFISSCIVMPNSIRTETYTDIFAAALFLAALDVAANPVSLAAALAALTRPHLAQHKAKPGVSLVYDSLQLVYVPVLHFLMLWLVECLIPGFSTGFFSAILGVLAISIPSFVSPSK